MIQGFSKARALFQKTARDVVAYRRFLDAHRIRPSRIRTFEDWKKIPPMGKKEYLYKYPLQELFPKGKIPPMVYASSGSSGHPTFWFRGDEQERAGASIHEKIFHETFGIEKSESTLVVICFSMGVWVAGNYTLACCRELAKQGYQISTVTPGIEIGDIMDTLKTIGPHFENVVIVGYPPFIMDVVNEAIRRKIPLRANTRFITAGDKFTEAWRTSLMELVGGRDPLRIVVSIYGSADAGVLGCETPLSTLLRREAGVNKALAAELFGDDPTEPALVQYDPAAIFFEEEGGELLFTTNTASPLIRYNIHDTGKIISFEEMKGVLKNHGLLGRAKAAGMDRLRMPFLIKRARNDVAVTFYALNIYPENIKAGLEDRRVKKYVSGQFFAFNKNIHHNKQQELCINVELASGVRPGKTTEKAIRESITGNLIAQNIEYRKLYSVLRDRALPKLKVVSFGAKHFYDPHVPGLVGIKGKKIKMLQAS